MGAFKRSLSTRNIMHSFSANRFLAMPKVLLANNTLENNLKLKHDKESETKALPQYCVYAANPIFALNLRIVKLHMALATSVAVIECVRDALRQLPRNNVYESMCYEIYRNLHRRFYLMGPWVVLVGTKFFVIPAKHYSGAIHFQLGPELQIFLYFIVDKKVELNEHDKMHPKAIEKPEKSDSGLTVDPSHFGYEPLNAYTKDDVKEKEKVLGREAKTAKSPMDGDQSQRGIRKTSYKHLKSLHASDYKKVPALESVGKKHIKAPKIMVERQRSKHDADLELKKKREEMIKEERKWLQAAHDVELLEQQQKKDSRKKKRRRRKSEREEKRRKKREKSARSMTQSATELATTDDGEDYADDTHKKESKKEKKNRQS